MPSSKGLSSLRGHGAFDLVFGEGKSFFQHPFLFKYHPRDTRSVAVQGKKNATSESPTTVIHLGISVPKRRFKRAVDRNLIRRRVREAYRLNRYRWGMPDGEPYPDTAIVLVYSTNEILDFDRIQEGLCKAMIRWRQLANR
jgi:ribonuclease P protein component